MTRIPTPPPTPYTDKRWRPGQALWQALATPGGHRCRVIIDNDFSGDPDDLFQLVHRLLSPNVEIRAVIGSHLREGDPFDAAPDTAANAVAVAADVFARMGAEPGDLLLAGAAQALASPERPRCSAAVERIIAEALREDTAQPLYYLAGGGLTEVAPCSSSRASPSG